MATDTLLRAPGVLGAARQLRGALGGVDPGCYSGTECARVAEELASTEKACAAVRLLCAARAVELGAHKAEGVADPATWLARQGGTTGAQARSALELARSLESHPKTKDALVSGAVSVPQAEEVLRLAEAHPGTEEALLDTARNGDLTAVRDEARERRLASKRPEDLHRAQHAARRLRHWRDDLGMVRLEAALPPETGIPLVARIEREALRLRAEAKRSGGEPEPFCAYAADALFALCTSGAQATSTRTDLVIVCDLYAFRRGHTHEGEVCHIVGGGPVPVEIARALAKDAFLKCVLHDGKDVQRVFHHGRRYTAELKTALDLGPVPDFCGRACVDCGRRFGVQYDHEDPVAHTGKTSLSNVVDRCYPCHAEKTERDRKAGLLGRREKARAGPRRRGGSVGSPSTTPGSARAAPGGTGPPGRDPPS